MLYLEEEILVLCTVCRLVLSVVIAVMGLTGTTKIDCPKNKNDQTVG